MTLWAHTHTPISPEKQTVESETLQGYEAISEQNSELRVLYQTQCEGYFAYIPGYPTYPPSTGKWVHVTVRVTKDPAKLCVSKAIKPIGENTMILFTSEEETMNVPLSSSHIQKLSSYNKTKSTRE